MPPERTQTSERSVIVPPAPDKPMQLDETSRVLMDAAAIVRERWQQNHVGRQGGRRCGWGAIVEVTGGMNDVAEEAGFRVMYVVGLSLPSFNDVPGRTAEEVAEAMERAAIGFRP